MLSPPKANTALLRERPGAGRCLMLKETLQAANKDPLLVPDGTMASSSPVGRATLTSPGTGRRIWVNKMPHSPQCVSPATSSPKRGTTLPWRWLSVGGAGGADGKGGEGIFQSAGNVLSLDGMWVSRGCSPAQAPLMRNKIAFHWRKLCLVEKQNKTNLPHTR